MLDRVLNPFKSIFYLEILFFFYKWQSYKIDSTSLFFESDPLIFNVGTYLQRHCSISSRTGTLAQIEHSGNCTVPEEVHHAITTTRFRESSEKTGPGYCVIRFCNHFSIRFPIFLPYLFLFRVDTQTPIFPRHVYAMFEEAVFSRR